MYVIACPVTRHEERLGSADLLSSHLTPSGVADYLRCGCGEVVVSAGDRVRHALPAVGACQDAPHVGTPTVRRTDRRTLAHHLTVVGELAVAAQPEPSAALVVNDAIKALVQAANAALPDFTFAAPAPVDPMIVQLRALGRLAQKTAGRTVAVCPPLGDRLDELCAELAHCIR